MAKVFISYTGHAKQDADMAAYFADYLSARKHDIFIQTKIAPGRSWPEVVDTNLREADYLVVLISGQSVQSDMVIEEVRRGARLRHDLGRPVILPVRLGTVEMPYDLGAKVNRIQGLKWTAAGDEDTIAEKLAEVLRGKAAVQESEPVAAQAAAGPGNVAPAPSGAELSCPVPVFDASWLKSLDAQRGSVRPDSPFYISRPQDDICKQRVIEKDHTLLVRGSRQIGKSSLLGRLYRQAIDQKVRAVYIDFQMLGRTELQSLEALLTAIANQIYDDLSPNNELVWNKNRTASQNLTRYLQNEIIGMRAEPVLLLMDEVDRLFDHPEYRDDFFALVRYWHEARKRDLKLVWLNLVLAYSTDASLFIKGDHQSPFNVGEEFELSDFTREQFQELNFKHGTPVQNAGDVDALMKLLGGHPFLVRKALYELTVTKMALSDLIALAASDDGPFNGHLQYYMFLFHEGPDLMQPMKSVLENGICPDDLSFSRLRSTGLIRGPNRMKASPRCGLYAQYLGARL
jgi:AAA-like domain/TIR domain